MQARLAATKTSTLVADYEKAVTEWRGRHAVFSIDACEEAPDGNCVYDGTAGPCMFCMKSRHR